MYERKLAPKNLETSQDTFLEHTLHDEDSDEYNMSYELRNEQVSALDRGKYLPDAYDYQRAAAAVILVAMFVIPGCEQGQI